VKHINDIDSLVDLADVALEFGNSLLRLDQ
jgi:hypothetical protein